MSPIFTCTYQTPVGPLVLGSHAGAVCLCDWVCAAHRAQVDRRLRETLHADFQPGQCDILDEAIRQLDAYFAGTLRSFDLPLRLTGTPFQQAAWAALQQIPYGETRTYAEQAQQMGSPRACRAVGTANGANALAILIPCHRVVPQTSGWGGYSGGTEAKRWLLEWERVHSGL